MICEKEIFFLERFDEPSDEFHCENKKIRNEKS